MGLENGGELFDVCKQGWHSVAWLLVVPLLVLIGPAIRPAHAMHHFTFHRMQHYEFAQVVRGSPGVALNCEVRTLFSVSVARRCLVMSWKEFISGDLPSIVQKGIVALIVALPQNSSSLTEEERDSFVKTEQTLLRMELQIPVYFVEQNPEVEEWLESLSFHVGLTGTPQTATEELLQQVTGDYYYLSSSIYTSKQISDVKVSNMVGRLSVDAGNDQQPMIVLVTHLDSAGVAPGLSYGANSDASGVAAVLEIVRILGKLVKSQKSPPKTDLIVLLSGAGKFNFFGTKKWLEEQTETPETSLIPRIQYALCLDGIGGVFPPRVYVSRPPKEGNAAYRALEMLNRTLQAISGQNILLVHKKINLAEEELVWEHEQFSLAKVAAMTVSTIASEKAAERKSIMDEYSDVSIQSISQTVQMLTKTLAAEMFGLKGNDSDILHDSYLSVSEENIASWMKLLTQQPRPLQLLVADHPALAAVKDYLTKQLVDFKVKQLVTDKGESEILLHGPVDVPVTASRTKQPFFDLLISTVIGVYGGLMFVLIQYVDIIGVLRGMLRPLLVRSSIKMRSFKSMKYQ